MQLLQKFKGWLRRWVNADVTIPPPRMGGKPATINDGAAQLVERARQGDQNAIALICQVRDNAKKGLPRAKQAVVALGRYIERNPVDSQGSMGEELAEEAETDALAEDVLDCCFEGDYVEVVRELVPDLATKSIPKAIVALANGPSLLPADGATHITDVRDSLTDAEKKAFAKGYRQGMRELDDVPTGLQCAFLLGHILGTARRIQAVRLPGVPVSVLSPSAGFELGE
jgi:hypothetical protein